MTDEQALYRGILENPYDDTVRLVYADYIEEYQGRWQQAEYIRACITMSREEFDSWVELRGDLVLGVAEPGSIRPNFYNWYYPGKTCGSSTFSYRSGFPYAATYFTNDDSFYDKIRELVATYPVTEILKFTDDGTYGAFRRVTNANINRIRVELGLPPIDLNKVLTTHWAIDDLWHINAEKQPS